MRLDAKWNDLLKVRERWAVRVPLRHRGRELHEMKIEKRL